MNYFAGTKIRHLPMKQHSIIAVCLLLSTIFFLSCGNGKLSQSEAKKQIEAFFATTKENQPQIEITSISEAAANAQGMIVTNVEYKNSIPKPIIGGGIAIFVKNQDGWRLKKMNDCDLDYLRDKIVRWSQNP